MDASQIRFIGRHIKKKGMEYFSYSGCGFEFVLIPKEKKIGFALSLVSELNDHDSQYIAFYLNDVFYSKEKLIEGENKVNVELESSDKEVLVRVIKLNEVYLSAIYLKDIVLRNGSYGKLKEEKKKLIEFYGDSLTCGYGVIDYHGPTFKMETEEFNKTYAYLVAKELDMNYSVVARSGISISLLIYVQTPFNDIYETVDMFDKCEERKTIDYAVINLGSNDDGAYSLIKDDIEREKARASFKYDYHRLIERIIKDNPRVKILITYKLAPMQKDIIDLIKEIYLEVSSKYDNQFKLVEFVSNTDGANSHPYYTGQENAAKVLVKAIKELERE